MIRASSYHQKNDLTQTQLLEYGLKAGSQEDEILTFLKGKGEFFRFTCETLESVNVLSPGTPHSSYIRAIANLRKRGAILKAGQVEGKYGRPINQYCLKNNPQGIILEVQ